MVWVVRAGLQPEPDEIAARDVLRDRVFRRQLTDVQAVLAGPDLLCQKIAAQVLSAHLFSVALCHHHDIDGDSVRRIFKAELISEPAREAVFDHSLVEHIGDEHPVLVLAQAEQIRFLVQLDLIGLFGMLPCRVAAAANVVEPGRAQALRSRLHVAVGKSVRNDDLQCSGAFRGLVGACIHFLYSAVPIGFIDPDDHDGNAVLCRDQGLAVFARAAFRFRSGIGGVGSVFRLFSIAAAVFLLNLLLHRTSLFRSQRSCLRGDCPKKNSHCECKCYKSEILHVNTSNMGLPYSSALRQRLLVGQFQEDEADQEEDRQ